MTADPLLPTVGVLGAGTMGSGIAQVAAVAGHPVILQDMQEAAVAKARAGIERRWPAWSKKAGSLRQTPRRHASASATRRAARRRLSLPAAS
jgi:3-hydroxybutyryl-CoA dehydrogenase